MMRETVKLMMVLHERVCIGEKWCHEWCMEVWNGDCWSVCVIYVFLYLFLFSFGPVCVSDCVWMVLRLTARLWGNRAKRGRDVVKFR
jgi:hypothetical protein